MNITDKLLEATKDIWQSYYEHPFVLGIQNGTLDKEKFRYYILQDYLYLMDYAKVFAVGLAKAKYQETRNLFSSYIRTLGDCEMDIHRGYMGAFGITKEEVAATQMNLDNLSYTSYMLRVAYEEGEAETLAAILSCALSYEFIAKNMIRQNPKSVDHPFYGDWITGYAGDDYHKENLEILEVLEMVTEDYTEKQIQHLVDIFDICSRYELAFWDMAWKC